MKSRLLFIVMLSLFVVAFVAYAQQAPAPAEEGHTCTKDQAAKAAATETHACNHGEKAAADTPKKQCPKFGTKTAEGTDVTLTGNLLCTKCNLKQTAECSQVFQMADEAKTTYKVCEMTKLEELEKISDHGKTLLTIKGKLMQSDEGPKTLFIASAEKAATTSK